MGEKLCKALDAYKVSYYTYVDFLGEAEKQSSVFISSIAVISCLKMCLCRSLRI